MMCSAYVGEERRGYRGGFWWRNLRERVTCKTQVKMGDNIKVYLQEVGGGALTGLIWLRIGTGGWVL